MIHKYKLNGYNIVLDINSGGVHIVDDLTYDLLDNVFPPFKNDCPKNVVEKLSKFYNSEDIKSCYAEIVELYNSKILFSEDEYEKFAKYSVNAPVKAMCLHIAHDCNLRCEYCFASTGDFGVGRKLMPLETGKKAIDFLLENSGDRENLELDFFGGEPLMNWEVVKQIVLHAREREKEYKNKKFRFTITTNGTLLNDEKIDFINKEMYNVVLSIDGRKEVNDKVRTHVNGTGCYDEIIEKYKKLVDKREGKDYYVRGTFTKYNLDFSEDVMHLADCGFEQISVEPVIGDPKEPYSIVEKDLPIIFAEYEKLAMKMIELNKVKFCNFFHFMIDLDQGPCAIKRLRGCSCGNEYVAITPDADIYPCHQFVGQEEFKMGNLMDNTFNSEIKDYFSKSHIYSKNECTHCWAKFYCSGGCNANNYFSTGDIHNVNKLACELQKKRLECAIMIKAHNAMTDSSDE